MSKCTSKWLICTALWGIGKRPSLLHKFPGNSFVHTLLFHSTLWIIYPTKQNRLLKLSSHGKSEWSYYKIFEFYWKVEKHFLGPTRTFQPQNQETLPHRSLTSLCSGSNDSRSIQRSHGQLGSTWVFFINLVCFSSKTWRLAGNPLETFSKLH